MRLHQIWLGSEVPKHLMTFAESWKKHHPHDEYRLWRDEDIENLDLVNWPLWRVAHKRVPADAVYQFKADLARYEILYRYGGVYADMDTTCQRSTHDLFDTDHAVLGWEVQNRWIGNTVIYAPQYHQGMKAIIDTIPQVAREYYPRVTRPNKLSGPKMITPILSSRDDVTILDEHIFYPVPYSEPERSTEDHPDSYVVHHWQHQRDMRGIRW
jgi:mannosyltransferase OCH1-like enzyme